MNAKLLPERSRVFLDAQKRGGGRAADAEERVRTWLCAIHGERRVLRRGKDELHRGDVPRAERASPEWQSNVGLADFLVTRDGAHDLSKAIALVEVKSVAADLDNVGEAIPRWDGVLIDGRALDRLKAEQECLERATGIPCDPKDRADQASRYADLLVTDGLAPSELRVADSGPLVWVAVVLQGTDGPVAMIPLHLVERLVAPCLLPSGDRGWVLPWSRIPATYWHDLHVPSWPGSVCTPPTWATDRARRSRDAVYVATVDDLDELHEQSNYVPATPLSATRSDRAPSNAQLTRITRLACALGIDPPRPSNARAASSKIGELQMRCLASGA
jgi:hypothetical protein